MFAGAQDDGGVQKHIVVGGGGANKVKEFKIDRQDFSPGLLRDHRVSLFLVYHQLRTHAAPTVSFGCSPLFSKLARSQQS